MEKDEAAAKALSTTLSEAQKALRKKGVTLCKVATRLRESLDATEVAPKFNGGPAGDDTWKYSKKLVAHGIRIQAIKIAAQLLEMEPAEKIDMTITDNLAEKISKARERRRNAGSRTKD